MQESRGINIMGKERKKERSLKKKEKPKGKKQIR